MIEITCGTLEEQIIKLLQKTYPITLQDIIKNMHISKTIAIRELKKLQTKGIVRLEPLPDKTFIRLQRNDFSFVGKRRQRKFIKHTKSKKVQEPEEYNGMMYS